jgi:hypothetical protein
MILCQGMKNGIEKFTHSIPAQQEILFNSLDIMHTQNLAALAVKM